MTGNLGKLAFYDFFVQALHVISSEWRDQGAHLIEHAPQGPDITLPIIGLVFPHFWGGIVWGPCLRVTEAFFDDLRHIQIAQFRCHVFVEEYVCTLILGRNFTFISLWSILMSCSAFRPRTICRKMNQIFFSFK
jgi:hypothetical protein